MVASGNPVRSAARSSSGSCMPRTKPTIAPAARPAANCSPIAHSRGCSRAIGHGLLKSGKNAPKSDGTRSVPTTSRQQPLDRLDELVHREGLADIVIDAEHFGVSLVPRAFVGGDHDHAHWYGPRATELFQDEKAAPLGHHHVEDDEIRIFSLGHRQALIAIASDKNLVALGLQGI